VTNEQYGRFLSTNPNVGEPKHWKDNRLNRPEQPAVGVSWQEAQAYCRWAGLRLPSEAQWEAAARGTDGRRYPWGDAEPTPEHANFGNRIGRPTRVGLFLKGAGPFGALDQAGNVWEWCEDVWDAAAYRKRAGERGPVSAASKLAGRCLRGGAWNFGAGLLATAFRYWNRASVQYSHIGFRCVSPAVSDAFEGVSILRQSWGSPGTLR
jgi:formylglycine-generating enzyme